MKRILSLLLFFVGVCAVNAQSVQFGIMGDIAFDRAASSQFVDGGKGQVQPDLGWSVGGKVRLSSMAGLGLDFGAAFAQADKSFTWTESKVADGAASTESYTAEGRLNYLSIPLNIRFDLKIPAISKGVIPYAYAGPEFNWFFDGVKWNGEDVIKHAKEYVNEQTAVWNLNFGFGIILVKHVELSYKYTVHLSDCLELKDNMKDKGHELKSRFKDKTNKIALTLYF